MGSPRVAGAGSDETEWYGFGTSDWVVRWVWVGLLTLVAVVMVRVGSWQEVREVCRTTGHVWSWDWRLVAAPLLLTAAVLVAVGDRTEGGYRPWVLALATFASLVTLNLLLGPQFADVPPIHNFQVLCDDIPN